MRWTAFLNGLMAVVFRYQVPHCHHVAICVFVHPGGCIHIQLLIGFLSTSSPCQEFIPVESEYESQWPKLAQAEESDTHPKHWHTLGFSQIKYYAWITPGLDFIIDSEIRQRLIMKQCDHRES